MSLIWFCLWLAQTDRHFRSHPFERGRCRCRNPPRCTNSFPRDPCSCIVEGYDDDFASIWSHAGRRESSSRFLLFFLMSSFWSVVFFSTRLLGSCQQQGFLGYLVDEGTRNYESSRDCSWTMGRLVPLHDVLPTCQQLVLRPLRLSTPNGNFLNSSHFFRWLMEKHLWHWNYAMPGNNVRKQLKRKWKPRGSAHCLNCAMKSFPQSQVLLKFVVRSNVVLWKINFSWSHIDCSFCEGKICKPHVTKDIINFG